MKSTADDIYQTNRLVAAGQINTPLRFSHKTYGEAFYIFELGIERRSGYVDEINVMVSERLLCQTPLAAGDFVELTGQIRTYNEMAEGRNKLNVVAFAREISVNCEAAYYENYVYLDGFLCKPPIKRTSPLGRDICDMMIAVNRMYNKSDYIPCIAWGRNAQYAARFHVGDQLRLTGRLQSREYQKLLESGEYLTRNAYEVSAFTLDAPDAAPDFSTQPVDARLAFERAHAQQAEDAHVQP